MLPYALDAIDEAALCALIENQVSERSNLEYKRDLPGRGDEDVKEFLADVTSLANAQGGDHPTQSPTGTKFRRRLLNLRSCGFPGMVARTARHASMANQWSQGS